MAGRHNLLHDHTHCVEVAKTLQQTRTHCTAQVRRDLVFGGGGGGGGISTKIAHRGQFQVNVIPEGIFQSPIFSLRDGSKKKFNIASSRGLL